MSNFVLRLFCAALILTFFSGSLKAQVSQFDSAIEVAQTVKDLNESTAPIKNKEDLETHLSSQSGPLFDELSPQRRVAFISSLIFTQRGLASYSALPLRDLSVTSAYKVLALFGLQDQAAVVTDKPPQTKSEESMLFLGQLLSTPTTLAELPPIRNKFCSVVGTLTSCKYEYGSYCNARCDRRQEP